MLLYTLLWTSVAITISKAADSANATSDNLIPCNDGWFLHDGKCYTIFGDTRSKYNWFDAKRKCAAENGSLATVSSMELQDFLVAFLLLRTKKNAWMGLNDKENESEFVWDDGSPLTFTHWDRNQPSGAEYILRQEDCVEMLYFNTKNGIGTWNDESCGSERNFFCQANKSDTVLSWDPRFCTIEEGEGWKYLNNCYHIVTEAKSWHDAESHCDELYSGHLVTILDEPTEMFLNYLTSDYNETFWIGIKMQYQDTQMWSSGVHVMYKKYDLENNPYMSGSCVMKTGKNLWEIGPCDRKLPFICEKSDKSALILKKSPEDWNCPSQSKEWLDIGGEYCYIFETKKKINWDTANYICGRKECRSRVPPLSNMASHTKLGTWPRERLTGGTLASIHSEAETYILHHYLGKASEEQLLIGLHRNILNKNEFEWADGSSFDYTNWNDGEPNNVDELCGEIYTYSMRWNDIPCSIKKGYICSAKKVPPTIKVNASVQNECVCPNSSNVTSPEIDRFTSTSTNDVCSSGMSTKAVTGIIICILLIIFLSGIVLYQHRKQPFCKKIYNSCTHKDSTPQFNHISSEIILKPDEYE